MTRYEGILLIPIFIIICISKLIFYFINKSKKKSNTQTAKIDKSNKIKETEKSNSTKNNDNKINNNRNEDKSKNGSTENIKTSNDVNMDFENDFYDNNSSKVLVSLIIKLISILGISFAYYWIFMNYGEIPFTFEDFISHFLFPYHMANQQSNKNDKSISYPFSILLKYVGTINNLRQSHAVFALFIPLIFSGAFLITSKSEKPPDTKKEKELNNTKQELSQTPKTQEKETNNSKLELSQNSQKTKTQEKSSKKNQNVNKNQNKANSDKNNITDSDKNQNQTNLVNQEQNPEDEFNLPNSPYLPYYHPITVDFLRQIGVFVLVFVFAASCVQNGSVFRILVPAEALAYPIVAERLINHFLQLLFSVSSFISKNEQSTKDEEETKSLKMSAFLEKVVFAFVSLVLLVCLTTWDCLYARREAQRYVFSLNLWNQIAKK